MTPLSATLPASVLPLTKVCSSQTSREPPSSAEISRALSLPEPSTYSLNSSRGGGAATSPFSPPAPAPTTTPPSPAPLGSAEARPPAPAEPFAPSVPPFDAAVGALVGVAG